MEIGARLIPLVDPKRGAGILDRIGALRRELGRKSGLQADVPRQPWPSVAALLKACVVTLLGVVRGVGPDAVLIRMIVAAVTVAVVVAVAETLVRWFSQIR